MLTTDTIFFDYGDKPLLTEVTFSLKKGRLLHLKGGNGQGKTTLMRLLAGLIYPLQGDIRWNGYSIYEDLSSYQKNICYVGHKRGLSLHLTVAENCRFDSHWLSENHELLPLLTKFGLEDLANTPCGQLSAGQLHRVALLRIAMTNTSLWLLDEPFVALDERAVNLLTNSMTSHLENKGMIILTSHQSLPTALKGQEVYQL